MDTYNVHNDTQEIDECLTRGICNVNPTLSSIHEIILLYLGELSFYLTKLKELGIENKSIKDMVIFALFNIITNVEYNQEQFHSLISKLYNYIYESKALYIKYCAENNIEPQSKKSYFKYSKEFTIADAIRRGEKYFIKKSHGLSVQQKNMFDIMLFLIKSISIKLVELERLGGSHQDAYFAVLSMLSKMNLADFTEEEAKSEIDGFIQIYYNIVKDVYYKQVELFGENTLVDVSFTPEVGKSILVSGSDLKKLEMVLRATEGTEINVYTHGIEMLMAHTFPKLRAHPNLKGHFGSGMESSLIDFAAFPGPILMTKATLQKIDYFYRGRLYTMDAIAPQGVVRIKDDNFEPLIKSALSAKGFLHPKSKPSMKVGFDFVEVSKKIDEFFIRLEKKELKHLCILGTLNTLNPSYKDYFEEFFNMIAPDMFVISISYPQKQKNVFHPAGFCDYTLFYLVLKEILKRAKVDELSMSVFITRCDKHTISNLLYLKHIGIKNVYTCKCPVSLINPNIMQVLQLSFGVKEISNPAADIKSILKNED